MPNLRLRVIGRSLPPELGAHDGQYHPVGAAGTTVVTDPITTQASGSSLVVGVARASATTAAPTDNKGSTLGQLGTAHPYTDWPTWGTSLWSDAVITGGSGHTVTAERPSADEATVFVVEVKGGGVIEDFVHAQNTNQSPLVSGSVTTAGPALLIAFWWGNGGTDPHTTAPNNGFEILDSVLGGGSLIQGAVAWKAVEVAGTYNVSWTSGDPGGQTWLVAVARG